MVPWKYALVASLVVLIVGFVSGAVIFGHESPPQVRGAIIKLGPPSSLPNFPDQPWCNDYNKFCITQDSSGQLIAVYTYDTNPFFRSEGCTVPWRPDFSWKAPGSNQETAGWFRSGCSGATFDKTGHGVYGPAPRDLDQFKLTLVTDPATQDQHIEVDTRTLICGRSADDTPSTCERAPPPQ